MNNLYSIVLCFPVNIPSTNLRTGKLGSGGEWRPLKDCPAALCLEHTTPGGGGELLMITSITQGWSPVPRAYRKGDWSVKGAAVVRANGSIQMLDGSITSEIVTGDEKPKEEWEIADVIVDGGELIVMDQHGNILQTINNRSRKLFLGHLQLLLGG